MQIGIRVDLAVVIFHQCISAQGAKLGSALVNRLGVGVVELQIIRSGLCAVLQLNHGMAVLHLKNAFHLALRHRLCPLQIHRRGSFSDQRIITRVRRAVLSLSLFGRFLF